MLNCGTCLGNPMPKRTCAQASHIPSQEAVREASLLHVAKSIVSPRPPRHDSGAQLASAQQPPKLTAFLQVFALAKRSDMPGLECFLRLALGAH
jgi:hypothetical protein